MTIDEFAAMTRRVIAADGFNGFLPTACYPDRQELAALQGLTAGADPEPAVLAWAANKAGRGEPYLVAFRTGPAEFTVVRVAGGVRESAVYRVPAGRTRRRT